MFLPGARALVLAGKITTASIVVLGAQTILRLIWNMSSYQWKYFKSDYSQIPWLWEGFTGKTHPLWKAMPVLMKFIKTSGVQELFSLIRDPKTLQYKPIVYIGPSLGFDPTVFISDSKYFSMILNDTEGFPKYKPLYTLYESLLGMGLVNSEGENHRKQRKIITPVFHFGSLQAAKTILERNAKVFIEEELPKQATF
jgi:cytochrome P450